MTNPINPRGRVHRDPGAPVRACGRRRHLDIATLALGVAIVALLTIGGSGRAPSGAAAPPPPGRFDHGAAGTARNGAGGEIAPSPTSASWPGTGPGGNGGPFAFVGAHYGSLWGIAPGPNNSMGVGYCVMEDLTGERRVSRQPDPASWDAGEMARAAAVMASFGGDRVVPYAIDASGPYDLASGEWRHPALLGGGEYTRRRHIAVNFAVKMFVEDVSPSGAAAGRKLARDTAVVRGTGGDFAALQQGYRVAQRLARVADVQHAVGGIALRMQWGTPDGEPPHGVGTYPVTVAVTDSTGKPVGFVPVLQLSEPGIGSNRSVGTTARHASRNASADDRARRDAAAEAGWPTFDMGDRLDDDPRFLVRDEPRSATVTDAAGLAHFDVTIDVPAWELAFHAQAPTADVDLYAGTGIQGQITWSGPPQSASVHQTAPRAAEPSGRIAVRKVLDAADVQGDRDMSGFVFAVEPVDPADGEAATIVATGPDGGTEPVELPVGEYRIAEVERPDWAAVLADGGPVTVLVDAAPSPADQPIEVVYTNNVPAASITTRAADAHDGDKHVGPPDGAGSPESAGLAIVDEIIYRDVVPGTPYVARGRLLVDGCDRWCSTPAAIAEVPFVPESSDGVVVARFDLPGGHPLAAAMGVIVQELVVAATGRVVASHVDLDDPDQTVWFPNPTSNTTTTTLPTTTSTPAPASPSTPSSTSTTPRVSATSTTTTSAAAAPVASPTARPLARTGRDGSTRLLAAGIALAMMGGGTLMIARRPTPVRRR